MRLRRATQLDLPTLKAWDHKPHVIAATGSHAESADWEHEISLRVTWWEVLIGEVGNRPIGLVRIIDPAVEETHYWGDVGPNLRAIDIWIGEEADLGRSYGAEMMRLAIERCFERPATTAVLIDPLARNVRAHRFYERIGFRKVGPRRFGDDDCIVYRLTRDDWIYRQEQI